MAQSFHKFRLPPENGYPIIDKNSDQKTIADAVWADSSGWLAVVGAGNRVLGWSNENVTPASTNQTVAKYKSAYVPHLGVLMNITGVVAMTQTKVGEYADFSTATTGAFVVDVTNSTTSGQVLLLGSEDPNNLDTTVICCVAEPQDLAFAQA